MTSPPGRSSAAMEMATDAREENSMTDKNREERIRERAHSIWEREGRQEGQHDAHWKRARREIENEDGESGASASAAAESSATSSDEDSAFGNHPVEPAEGDRDTIERELERQEKQG